jgi:hypothetical protein
MSVKPLASAGQFDTQPILPIAPYRRPSWSIPGALGASCNSAIQPPTGAILRTSVRRCLGNKFRQRAYRYSGDHRRRLVQSRTGSRNPVGDHHIVRESIRRPLNRSAIAETN